MLRNTNRGPHGFNPDRVRGELTGQSGAGIDKMMLPILMDMLKNMDADALEGLRQSLLNDGPYNSAKTTPATTSIQYTEQQRVKQLESMRMAENSHFIDEAISSGESPENAAIRIVKATIEQEEAVNQMIDFANQILDRRNGRR
ncbi:hypothetical protein [Paenibacillus sp. AR247]|uniref:hypothetical protein n=1 Tax=Paenibacillus sp. AR247 TaxID=1631599 RepID=UPI000CF90BFA|nr:hypothetical protein [Paenibacillus sp. AR247]PQP89670.1 hypothetical protein CPT76_16880 [Paenibacillus sp. AR247]